MAILEFLGEKVTDPKKIESTLGKYGIPYEHWGIKALTDRTAEGVLKTYDAEVESLKNKRGYITQDIIALDPATPGLDVLAKKFDREHHHTDDEVRFTVDGEGVFEINIDEQERIKFTAQAGDLIVIPAYRRHLFYLTEKRTIRCIRLFKDSAGWEALYPLPQDFSSKRKTFFGVTA